MEVPRILNNVIRLCGAGALLLGVACWLGCYPARFTGSSRRLTWQLEAISIALGNLLAAAVAVCSAAGTPSLSH